MGAVSPIPVAIIAPVLKRLFYPGGMLRDTYNDVDLVEEHDVVTPVCERAGVNRETIFRAMTEPRYQNLEFDVVDRVLVALNAQHLWWTELSEIYYSVDLSQERCINPGCERYFKQAHAKTGKTRKRYCSKACNTSHKKLLLGETLTRRKDYFSSTKCRNGHPKTAENTKFRSDGRTECKLCANASGRRHWAKKGQT